MQTQITIVERETIALAWWRLIITAPEVGARLIPGQFLLVRCADPFTCYLRRPVFPTQLDDEHIALLIRPHSDPGLAWLSARQPGDTLEAIGPLGRGFPLADHVRNLLLVADGQAIDPLLGAMTVAMRTGVSVTLALGGSRAAALFPVNRLPSAVEVQFATRDGSLGHRGSVTDLLPDLLRWADAVYTVGSTRLYLALKDRVRAIRLAGDADFLYGLVAHALLPCGVGACLVCTVPASDGLKLACVDGPVFDLMALDLGK